MQEKEQVRYEYPYIDIFRVVAALFVVAIHIAPLNSFSERADYFLTYCIGRIAVPFFLIVTGYFTLGGKSLEQKFYKIRKAVYHLGAIYVFVTLLYLPVNYYAGNLPRTWGEVLKQIVFDGTFYHLWYLPAAILGMLIVYALLRLWGYERTFLITFILYLVGILGDSYYGLVQKIPELERIYDIVFSFSSYTRNGIFFTPIFLCMGGWLGKEQYTISKEKGKNRLMVCIIGLLLEGEITGNLQLQRHNSMYLCLVPTVFFLMSLLLLKRKKAEQGEAASKYVWLRDISLWIYLLHPMCIIAVRGVAKAVNLKEIFVDNSLMFYVLVCISSFCMAFVVLYILNLLKCAKKKKTEKKRRKWHDNKSCVGEYRTKQGMD